MNFRRGDIDMVIAGCIFSIYAFSVAVSFCVDNFKLCDLLNVDIFFTALMVVYIFCKGILDFVNIFFFILLKHLVDLLVFICGALLFGMFSLESNLWVLLMGVATSFVCCKIIKGIQ